MRCFNGFKTALVGGAVGLLAFSGLSRGQVITNPAWELPPDATDSTSTTATGWTMTASGETGMLGNRAAFYNNTPGGRWSYWLQDFETSGSATQVVTGTTAGTNYTFRPLMLFELGSGSTVGVTDGYNDVPGMNSFIEMQFQDSSGNPVGSPDLTNIPSGSVPLSGNRTWNPYPVSGVAPAGSSQVLLEIGWTGGTGNSGTGSQSAFADDLTLTAGPVPEPASLGLLMLGGLVLTARHRWAKLV